MRKQLPLLLFSILLSLLIGCASIDAVATEVAQTAAAPTLAPTAAYDTTGIEVVGAASPTSAASMTPNADVLATIPRSANATSPARPSRTPTPAKTGGFPTITMSQLPPEALQTIALINKGGPFPYRQDGVVFENRERILPIKPSGYYHEYTVITPGSPDRGARRIITGQNGEMYYTDDHYASFKRIVQ